MRDQGFVFSDSQTITNVTSTGEVSSNTWDLETNAPVDDQVVGFVNITIISAVVSGMTEGLEFQVRTAAAEALTSVYEIVGAISVIPGKVVAGAQFSIPINFDVCQKQLGVWAKAISTSNTGAIVFDAEFSVNRVSPNGSLQKMPS